MQKPHEFHAALTNAFASADAGTPKGSKYGLASTGMPISPGRQASVMKAAQTSAKNRSARADVRNATAPDLAQVKTTATGSIGLNKPKLSPPLKKGGF